MRFAAKCEIAAEEHRSVVVLGEGEGIPTADYGAPAVEVLDADLEPTVGDDELELLRIRAGTPRFGREIDDRVLPAEAGLDARAVNFEKGCYPGQEPIARQHYRGRVNRSLRVLAIEGGELPGVRRGARLRGQDGRPGDERGPRRRSRRRARLRASRGPAPTRVLELGGRSVTQLDLPSPRP